MRIFVALLQNVFKVKKRNWKRQTVDNYRTLNLLRKGFKGFKSCLFCIETKYKNQPELRNQYYNDYPNVQTNDYISRYSTQVNFRHQHGVTQFTKNHHLPPSSTVSHHSVIKVSF